MAGWTTQGPGPVRASCPPCPGEGRSTVCKGSLGVSEPGQSQGMLWCVLGSLRQGLTQTVFGGPFTGRFHRTVSWWLLETVVSTLGLLPRVTLGVHLVRTMAHVMNHIGQMWMLCCKATRWLSFSIH